MESKTKALALLSVVLVAVVVGSLVFALQTVKADNVVPVASDASTPSAAVTPNDNTSTGGGPMMFAMDQRGFGMGPRGMGRGCNGFGPQAIQISSDYTANVTNIVKSDSDVANLISQNYNITAIRPVFTTSVDGNGNVATKASTADVLLVGPNGHALVVVNLDEAKVTKIVNYTVTEIDK